MDSLNKDIVYKKAFIIGSVSYLVLLFLSILFYKERTVFIDNAYFLFFLLKDGTFVPNLRFIADIPQIPVLLERNWGISLNAIMLTFSAIFVILYYIYFLLAGIVFKNYKIALTLLFISLLFVSDSFYWMLSELPQGIGLMLLLFSIFLNRSFAIIKPFYTALIFAGLFVIAFSHPLIVIAFAYTILFFIFDAKKGEKNTLYAVLFFYLLISIIKSYAFSSSYDANASTVAMNNIKAASNFFDLYANKHFLDLCLTRYYWIPALLILSTYVYVRKRYWKKLLLLYAFFFGYLFLVNASYPNKDVHAFYIENLYLPLALILALPFIYDVIPALHPVKVAIPLFTLIIITGLVRIYTSHELYTNRLNWERNFLKQNGDTKLVVDAKKTPMDLLLMPWATPYEFWLLSTSENNKTASILISYDPQSYVWTMNRGKTFLPTWCIYNYSDFPSQYFIFKDTATNYTLAK